MSQCSQFISLLAQLVSFCNQIVRQSCHPLGSSILMLSFGFTHHGDKHASGTADDQVLVPIEGNELSVRSLLHYVRFTTQEHHRILVITGCEIRV